MAPRGNLCVHAGVATEACGTFVIWFHADFLCARVSGSIAAHGQARRSLGPSREHTAMLVACSLAAWNGVHDCAKGSSATRFLLVISSAVCRDRKC